MPFLQLENNMLPIISANSGVRIYLYNVTDDDEALSDDGISITFRGESIPFLFENDRHLLGALSKIVGGANKGGCTDIFIFKYGEKSAIYLEASSISEAIMEQISGVLNALQEFPPQEENHESESDSEMESV